MAKQTTPRELVDQLVALLRVEPQSDDIFLGARTPEGSETGAGRVFGGQVIAQALAAAEATVPDGRPPNSLHAYFLRMGDDAHPIRYEVARDLDGGTFSNRRVLAHQGDRLLLSMTASFHRREDGVSHQEAMPDVPPPEDLLTDIELRRDRLHRFPPERRDFFALPRAIEQRPVEDIDWVDTEAVAPLTHTWFRSSVPIGDEPGLHRAILAYASDLTMLRTAMLPHGLSWFRDKLQEASLDHSIWFHDDFRADEWLLYVTHSAWTGRGRGHITGKVYRRDGRLVATVTQEGMLRVIERG